jgi:hypothetical protein
MNPYWIEKGFPVPFKKLSVACLGLCLSLGPQVLHARQNQQDDVQEQRNDAPADSPMQGPQYSPGHGQQGAPQQGQPAPYSQEQSTQPAPPESLTLPAGTVVRVRIDEWISTDRNVTGDSFSAVLDQPLVVNGWVVARRGQAQTGRVSLVIKGGHGNGNSQLGVDLPDLTLVDGQQLPLQTELFQTSAGSSAGRNAAIVGSTTGLGAVIGAIAGGGTGAAIGAGVGATAGIAGVMSTPGKPTTIAPETILSFRLQNPITVSTVNSQFAFQPVSQSDFDSHPRQYRQRTESQGPPPPSYYGYPYAYGYPYGWYPTPYIGLGFYGGYGRYGGFRGFRR